MNLVYPALNGNAFDGWMTAYAATMCRQRQSCVTRLSLLVTTRINVIEKCACVDAVPVAGRTFPIFDTCIFSSRGRKCASIDAVPLAGKTAPIFDTCIFRS